MARTKKRFCYECRKLFRQGRRCPKSNGLQHKACKQFVEGRAIIPKFQGEKLREVKLDPSTTDAFVVWTSPTQYTIFIWEVDHNDSGQWRIHCCGLDDDGPIQKQLSKNSRSLAFHGEIVVRGARRSDLWSSAAYEDPDVIDLECNVTNKAASVVLIPTRSD